MSVYCQISGEGTPLVLLHGWGFHSEIWQRLIAIGKPEFQFYSLDLPGFGRSADLTFSDRLDETIEALLPSLPDQAIYLGWSLGGLLAMKLALTHPEKVRAVFALSSTPCFLQQSDWRGVSLSDFEQFRQAVIENPQKILKTFILSGLVDRPQQKQHVGELWDLLLCYGFPRNQSLLNALNVLKQHDLRLAIPSIKPPVFFGVGRSDSLTPYNESLCQHRLQALGHFPLWTDADEVLHLLKRVNNEII